MKFITDATLFIGTLFIGYLIGAYIHVQPPCNDTYKIEIEGGDTTVLIPIERKRIYTHRMRLEHFLKQTDYKQLQERW